jgi:hypothetical protein
MYVIATETISTAYFINPSHLSVYLYRSYHCWAKVWLSLSLHSVLGNGSVNTFPRQQIHATIEELFDACVSGCLLIPLSLLGNSQVKTFPRQRRIVGGVILYAVHVISKESRQLVVPRTSFSILVTYNSMLTETRQLVNVYEATGKSNPQYVLSLKRTLA